MLHQLIKPPAEKFLLAFSGGVDSVAIADFYIRGSRNFEIAYFNHGTLQSNDMEKFVREWAETRYVPYVIGTLTKPKSNNVSPEEHWRNERYAWLYSFNMPVVTCHHLNDAAETWLFSAMNGVPKLIAPAIKIGEKQLYRPFLLNPKQNLIDWCLNRSLTWFEDLSNLNTQYPRNRIRHNILPEVLKINPGFLKVIKKKYLLYNDLPSGKSIWQTHEKNPRPY